MWGVFTNYLQLDPSEIVAMTTLNFTGATNPKNATSVYKGLSSYTRCVWEVKVGNAVSTFTAPTRPSFSSPASRPQDLCVADFWETAQRRGISTFTSPVKVDKLKLVTKTKSLTSDTMFAFPDGIDGSRPFPLPRPRPPPPDSAS
jgi:hypothetical protein